MPIGFTRRRFLTVSAAASLCAGSAPIPVARWTGQAMGAPASLEFSGLSDADARPIFRAVRQEVARLERIFSLADPSSQIVQLNRTGILRAPAPELVEVLELCDRLHRLSAGVFDPTIQPLWLAIARGDPARQVEVAQLTGWQYLTRGSDALRFDGRGRALTLNGVAQGYVTDRIATLLRQRGLRNVAIDMGEIAVLGPERRQVGVADPQGRVVARVELSDRALATSAPLGTTLGPQIGHILDPHDWSAPPRHRLVSVSAPSAVLADGLSTMASLLPRDRIEQCLSQVNGAHLEALL